MNNSFIYLSFSPIINIEYLYGFILLIFTVGILVYITKKQLPIMRLLAALAIILYLANPSIIREERSTKVNIVNIIVDQSQSQNFGNRSEMTTSTLENIKKSLDEIDNVDYRISYINNENNNSETRIFKTIKESSADINKGQIAGTIILTDGQVHDIPKNLDILEKNHPIHALITGENNEKDRQVNIINAPSYGITGKNITIKYRIEEYGFNNNYAHVKITYNDNNIINKTIAIGQENQIEIPIEHAGQNIITIETENHVDEITYLNNKSAIIVNGLRDRLKVLLVSGEPHMGERVWRDLLSSDPSVDLIHFTILREPHKLNPVPSKELSLIAFPTDDLFNRKLHNFDLVIFDRYRLNRVMPDYYYSNIVRYVNEGGALLISNGPAFTGMNSTYNSSLKKIIPAFPTGNEYKTEFKPEITEIGKLHPITIDFDDKTWGSWLWQAEASINKGDVLISGVDKSPLLIISRYGEGRVAQITSDHTWLWARGYDNGGPYTELLKNISHWLMKEPELEEEALNIKTSGNDIIIKKRTMNNEIPQISMITPYGMNKNINIKEDNHGWYKAIENATETGIYEFDDGTSKRYAVIGNINPKELRDAISTTKKLAPIVKESKGSLIRISDNNDPTIKVFDRFNKNTDFGGNNLIALKNNNQYIVSGTKNIPLLPIWITLLFLCGTIIYSWLRESKR